MDREETWAGSRNHTVVVRKSFVQHLAIGADKNAHVWPDESGLGIKALGVLAGACVCVCVFLCVRVKSGRLVTLFRAWRKTGDDSCVRAWD